MIEKIEIAVLDRLNQAFGNTKPALGYKIEKIDSYKAELSDFGTLIKNRRTAALVACGGLSLEADYQSLAKSRKTLTGNSKTGGRSIWLWQLRCGNARANALKQRKPQKAKSGLLRWLRAATCVTNC